ncbi:hypothetical protein F4703DRAFT_1837768, partial [Phycomyces blakesleeanus]
TSKIIIVSLYYHSIIDILVWLNDIFTLCVAYIFISIKTLIFILLTSLPLFETLS